MDRQLKRVGMLLFEGSDLLDFAAGNAQLVAQRERLLAYRAAYGSHVTA